MATVYGYWVQCGYYTDFCSRQTFIVFLLFLFFFSLSFLGHIPCDGRGGGQSKKFSEATFIRCFPSLKALSDNILCLTKRERTSARQARIFAFEILFFYFLPFPLSTILFSHNFKPLHVFPPHPTSSSVLSIPLKVVSFEGVSTVFGCSAFFSSYQ